MDFVTGADVLTQVMGEATPTPIEQTWADLVAAAVNDGVTARWTGGAADFVPPPTAPPELVAAATFAAQSAYKRREVSFGVMAYADLQGQAYRIARDYISEVAPIIDRYRLAFGIA